MTTFWQESFSFSAHLAHIPSPLMVVFSPLSSARSTPRLVKSTPTVARANNFRIVGLHKRDQCCVTAPKPIEPDATKPLVEWLLNHRDWARTIVLSGKIGKNRGGVRGGCPEPRGRRMIRVRAPAPACAASLPARARRRTDSESRPRP